MARRNNSRRRRDSFSNRRLPPLDSMRSSRSLSVSSLFTALSRPGSFSQVFTSPPRALQSPQVTFSRTEQTPRRSETRSSRGKSYNAFKDVASSTPVFIGKNSNAPRDHSHCARRQERKEIMFASGNAGKTGQKTPVWTHNSRITCKRKK